MTRKDVYYVIFQTNPLAFSHLGVTTMWQDYLAQFSDEETGVGKSKCHVQGHGLDR